MFSERNIISPSAETTSKKPSSDLKKKGSFTESDFDLHDSGTAKNKTQINL
jgi:hypothetical protein